MSSDDLHRLIERWQALADEARAQTQVVSASDLSRATFYQGVMKTYLNVIEDLHDLFRDNTQPAAEPQAYLSVAEAEAQAVLQRAELFARSLTLHSDQVFTAVFSRLQPITLESRIQKLSAADARLMIVDFGTLRDTGDPYVDFAFVKS